MQDRTPDIPQPANATTDALTGNWIERVYDELRRLARQQMRREAGETLQTTVLVHEVYLRLFAGRQPEWQNRAHFFGAAARSMRQILIDRARARLAIRRGRGLARSPLDDIDAPIADSQHEDPDRLLTLQAALARLEQRDPRKAEIVMLRFFAGLTIQQTADVLDLSVTTVKDEWQFARAWLHHEMERGESP